MYLVTSEEMRRMERHVFEDGRVPSLLLMERAGLELAQIVREAYQERAARCHGGRGRVVVAAGKGNNGGDGLIAARHLVMWDIPVVVCAAVDPSAWTGDAETACRMARAAGVDIFVGHVDEDLVREALTHAPVVVDALLGTGSVGELRREIARICAWINESDACVISADIPTGVDADSGRAAEGAVRADVTVTFGLSKRGLHQHPGVDHAGTVRVVDIGLLPSAVAAVAPTTRLAGLPDAVARLPRRVHNSHKGSYGHVGIVGGALRMVGAAIMAGTAAYRVGSGLVSIATPSVGLPHLAGRVPELLLHPAGGSTTGEWLSGTIDQLRDWVKGKALAVGPGLGRFEGDGEWLRTLVTIADRPMVLDADAIRISAEFPEIFRSAAVPLVLTPHPKEFGLLAKMDVREVQSHRLEAARKAAQQYGVTCVLKGAQTVIANPNGSLWVNPTGNDGMATGGSGDVLAGVIAGLIGQGVDGPDAAVGGAYLHGLAGDLAVQDTGDRSMMATDLIRYLSRALQHLEETGTESQPL